MSNREELREEEPLAQDREERREDEDEEACDDIVLEYILPSSRDDRYCFWYVI